MAQTASLLSAALSLRGTEIAGVFSSQEAIIGISRWRAIRTFCICLYVHKMPLCRCSRRQRIHGIFWMIIFQALVVVRPPLPIRKIIASSIPRETCLFEILPKCLEEMRRLVCGNTVILFSLGCSCSFAYWKWQEYISPYSSNYVAVD